MLVSMKEMLVDARNRGFGVGAFEFWSYDSAKAILSAAAALNMPVILQIGHFECDYLDGYENARKIAEMISALYPSIPVALHLDHATEFEEVKKALDAGFTSVMIDASALPFEENIEMTSRVVSLARQYGASSEAELGTLAGNEGYLSNSDMQTDPEDASKFVTLTDVDCLAVAIGTAHGFYIEEPKINIPRLQDIAKKVSIPLVLHGGSGTPDDKVQEAICNGVAKVNICTELIAAFGNRLSEVQKDDKFKYNVFQLFREGMIAGQKLVESKIRLFNPQNVNYQDR